MKHLDLTGCAIDQNKTGVLVLIIQRPLVNKVKAVSTEEARLVSCREANFFESKEIDSENNNLQTYREVEIMIRTKFIFKFGIYLILEAVF
jgi:hypothetical protein